MTRRIFGALLLWAFAGTLTVAGTTGAPATQGAQHDVAIELIIEGLDSPLALADPNDGSGRLFVAGQAGIIYVVSRDGELLAEPLLDIRDALAPRREGLEERGLLGFALHPGFAENGWFYVHYSAPLREGATPDWNHTRHVSEFKVSADDPNVARRTSERVLIAVDWPTHKHNGGGLAFGPDGFLYVGLGDGGGVHGIGDRPDYGDVDELENGERWWPVWHHWDRLSQDLTTLFGKILRIDVDRGFPGYAVPADNPLVGREGRDEIFAWGFRQPYGFSFDRAGHGLFVSDTGHYIVEAIYLVNRPGNYGWPLKEGSRCFDPEAREEFDPEAREELDECPTTGPHGEFLIDPVIEYEHRRIGGIGTAVVGGAVYRGEALPELVGNVVFADWGTGLYTAAPAGRHGELWPWQPLLEIDGFVLSLAQDADDELYVLTNEVIGLGQDTGKVYKLVPATDLPREEEDEADAAAADPPAERTGWYTVAQAEAGQAAFREHCAACHGTDLRGVGPFPAIVGSTFMNRWGGQSATALYSYINTQMPDGAGGSLGEATYTDIFAYLLRRYGYPAGEHPLTPEPELLDQIVIEPQ